MKFSIKVCIICMFFVLTPQLFVDSATTGSTFETSSFSSTTWSSYATIFLGNSVVDISTESTSSTKSLNTSTGSITTPSIIRSRPTGNISNSENSTTTQTTQNTTTSVLSLKLCKNGTCAGNESSCLNETITDTCILTDAHYCYQIVYENGTDSYYDVGCSTNCEFLVEETESVTKTTRCCDTNLCNNELLANTHEENDAIQITVHYFSLLLSVFVCKFFKSS